MVADVITGFLFDPGLQVCREGAGHGFERSTPFAEQVVVMAVGRLEPGLAIPEDDFPPEALFDRLVRGPEHGGKVGCNPLPRERRFQLLEGPGMGFP